MHRHDQRRLGRAGNGHCIAHMVIMGVSNEQDIHVVNLLVFVGARGVVRRPRINEQNLARGADDPEGAVPQPGNLHVSS